MWSYQKQHFPEMKTLYLARSSCINILCNSSASNVAILTGQDNLQVSLWDQTVLRSTKIRLTELCSWKVRQLHLYRKEGLTDILINWWIFKSVFSTKSVIQHWMRGQMWMKNREGCGRKQPPLILRYDTNISLQGLRQPWNTLLYDQLI
jgi:hypothetical protein